CHFDNYPSDEWAGKSASRTVYGDCMVQMDYVLGQLVDKLQQVGELENTLIILNLRQRTGVRNPAARTRSVSRLQRIELGGRRTRADLCVLERNDQIPAIRWSVRLRRHSPHCAVACRSTQSKTGRSIS